MEQIHASWAAFQFQIMSGIPLFVTALKSARIQKYSGLLLPAFGRNTERHSVSVRVQSECEKMRARITPNTETFQAFILFIFSLFKVDFS